MFDIIPDPGDFSAGATTSLDELRSFAGSHRDALLSAAELLGGRPGLRCCDAALEGLAQPGPPSRRTWKALDDLLALFMLENVHDEDRIEATLFAAIDPASACVEDICCLADQLCQRMRACRSQGIGASDNDSRRAAA